MTRRTRSLAVLGALVAVAIVAGLLIGGVIKPGGSQTAAGSSAANGSGDPGPTDAAGATPTPEPTPVPTPGHEVYGYLPYWEMTAGIAEHLARVDLTTLALFSVTNKTGGAIDTEPKGYQAIVGPLGQQLIREAHDRGVRVELVFSSFGTTRNKRLFGVTNSPKTQAKVIAGLVELAGQLKVDGINVDVEVIDDALIPAYGQFVGDLRTALVKAHPKGQVSVATTANVRGSAMALAASTAGADRIFLMGYDYHWSGSGPGASAPMDRRDGDEKDLVWSLDMYEALGVPVQRTILGLPLYGMAWPVVGPELGAAQTGRGTNWIPSDHLDFLTDPANVATLDDIEQVDQYVIAPPGVDPTASIDPSGSPLAWTAIYVDSPSTLSPKLALADARGLAGVGFWAMGYDRGLPDYAALIKRFRAGKVE